jgi:UDP-glucose 4-epimerase
VTVLITGGAGFIGSHVVDEFVAAGHEVVVVDNLSTGLRTLVNPEATLHELSLLDEGLLEVFLRHQPGLVCHHAAHVNVRKSVEDPVFDATQNILGTLRLLECARKTGVKKVIFASSGGAIYGEPLEDPVRETHPLRPISPYGGAKLACEQYLWMYGANYGVSSLCLRYANVYGPRQNPEGEGGVVAVFCRKMVAGERPTIYDDGEQVRDFVCVADVAAANLAAAKRLAAHSAEQPLRLAVNIGTGERVSINQLTALLRRTLNFAAEPAYAPAKLGELRAISLAADLATAELGWRPKVPLPEGLALTAEYFRRLGGGPLTR